MMCNCWLYCAKGYDEYMANNRRLFKLGKEYRKSRKEIMKYLYISTDARGMTGNY